MINVIQNNSVVFDIRPYLKDRGWRINSPSQIEHISSNVGELKVLSFSVESGRTYKYSFNVSGIGGTGFTISIGGVTQSISTNGYHQGEITTTGTAPITFYAEGNVRISNLDIMTVSSSQNIDGKRDTITWSENRGGWITFKDLVPESGFSMYTNLFTFKDGNLWIHTMEGTTPNNFYGVQYSSKIKFPVSSVGVKTYHSIAIHGNKVMGTTENGIQTQLGQISDLVNFDFDTKEGIHYANLLRDNLTNEKLKGRYIVIELTDQETKTEYLQLFKVVVKSNQSTVNE